MVLDNLKHFILQAFNKEGNGQEFNFQNTFSEVLNRNTTHEESLIMLMVLAPHILPGFYDAIIKELYPNGGEFPEWGGVKTEPYRSMQPTGETILYILGGLDIQKRAAIQHYFEPDHWFYKDQILYIEHVKEGMPVMSGKIILPPETLSLLVDGKISRPQFGPSFPAKEVSTLMEWDDLILGKNTIDQLQQLKLWMKHHEALRYDLGLEKRINPGYRALFCGPSGTGKTLTVSLLGKEFKKPVYRIDLSQIVSKYIGETEKNLEKIFSRAEHKDWILFFDEGDALFGKRSTTRTAQDRFANQGVSYLLQRIETFNGIVILASNYKNNIDQAFLRRFNNIINFVKPNADERLKLWQKAKPTHMSLDEAMLPEIARNYELTGAQIVSAMTYSCLQALELQTKVLSIDNVLKAVKIEFQKEERMFIELNSN
ncbi:ATP-binding protein [uncultured Psychroserpens sp.]|uniref:ATP-binding protein n=1 Tax=uncultured Psychroserpens sp. TaxID=255436 RepID=UPI00260A6AE1|nr:ATP-binding protein [uncultured Psychroserpens sp.]